MKLYVLVLEVNPEWRGFHERDNEELKALLDQLILDAIGYRGKIIGSELVEEPTPDDAAIPRQSMVG